MPFMRTMPKSGIISCLLLNLLLASVLNLVNGSDGNCTRNHVKTLANKMEVSWKLDKSKVVFTVTVHGMLDKDYVIEGWVALGFMKAESPFPPKQNKVAADFVVAFLKSKKNVIIQDCNTITDRKAIRYDKNQSYNKITKFIKIARHNNQVTFGVSRKPDTKDKEDLLFGDRPIWMITSYGMDALKKCSELKTSDIFDNKQFTRVCILPPIHNNSTQANGTDTNVASSWRNRAAQLAHRHWAGLIIGLAGMVTFVTVVVVYCMCRKPVTDGYKNKIMSFYKQRDDDDEARVSMLSAQMT